MTAHDIIQDVQSMQYKGIRFMGDVMRNNTRNKELTFCLRQYGKMQQFEAGGAARPFCYNLLEIDAVLDSKTGKIEWNYIDPAMQQVAEVVIIDPLYKTTLHHKLVTIFETKNTLKTKNEKAITTYDVCNGAEK